MLSTLKEVYSTFITEYKKTPLKLKIIDTFLLYAILTTAVQFVYMVLVGTFPFNSFLAGFFCSLGVFVLTVCLRMQLDPSNVDFKDRISPERALCATAGDTMLNQPIVSVEWLRSNLNKVKVLDATWYLPTVGKDPVAEFKAQRIPGSKFFDLDAIADHSIPLPHMLPTPKAFAAACDALGITNNDTVIVYDRSGIFSAPRVWWTFRVMGHADVAVLDGGFPAWIAAAAAASEKGVFPVDTSPWEDEEALRAPGNAASQASAQGSVVSPAYHAQLQPNSVRGLSDMQALVNTWSTTPVNARAAGLIVDARPAGRFTGTVPEPRAGMRSGHMPGAVNVPLTDMLTDDGCMKPADVLRAVFAAAHVGPGEGPLVFSCGTAVTACGVRLGYALAYPEGGDSQVSIYDGSWSEWGSREDTPVVT